MRSRTTPRSPHGVRFPLLAEAIPRSRNKAPSPILLLVRPDSRHGSRARPRGGQVTLLRGSRGLFSACAGVAAPKDRHQPRTGTVHKELSRDSARSTPHHNGRVRDRSELKGPPEECGPEQRVGGWRLGSLPQKAWSASAHPSAYLLPHQRRKGNSDCLAA